MKKRISFLICFLLCAVLLSACTILGGETDTTDTTDTTDASSTTQRDEETTAPVVNDGRYEYWYSAVSEGALEIDTESSTARFYSLSTGYYEYYTVDEGSYTFSDNVLTFRLFEKNYVFYYNSSNDTMTITNSDPEADDIVYERMETAPIEHPVYPFPDFESISFNGSVSISDYCTEELYQLSMEEARIKVFVEYYNSSLESPPEITDRTVQRGDVIDIDYIGYLNGTLFEGAGASDVQLSVIQNSQNIDGVVYPEGFIDAIIGKPIGEYFEIPISFPADYGDEALAGKTIIFETIVNNIYDIRLTEEQFATYTNLEYDTYEEYVVGVAKALVYESGISYVGAKAGLLTLLPEEAYLHFYQFYLDQAHSLAKDYRLDYNTYLEYTGQSETVMLLTAKSMALDFMLSYHIADVQGLDWTAEQYKTQFDSMVDNLVQNGNNKDKATEIVETTRMEELYAELTYRIAGEWLVTQAFGAAD